MGGALLLGVGDLADHPWHHYWTGGAEGLVLLLPLLGFGLLLAGLAAVRSLLRRATALVHRQRGDGLPAVPRLRPASRVLASDRERDEVAARLSHAVGEGRLTLAEATERIEAALASRHRHQLARLVADLPAAGVLRGDVDHRARVRRDVKLFAVCTLLAAVVVQVAAGAWALWPVAVASWAALALLPRPPARGTGRG